MLELVAGQRADTRAEELLPTLGAIGALAAHRGRFTRRELWRAARLASADHRAAVRVVLAFRRLRKLGFVSRAEHDDAQYLLHEGVAEFCIDRLWELPTFREAFTAVARARLATLATTDLPSAWLLATEAHRGHFASARLLKLAASTRSRLGETLTTGWSTRWPACTSTRSGTTT